MIMINYSERRKMNEIVINLITGFLGLVIGWTLRSIVNGK